MGLFPTGGANNLDLGGVSDDDNDDDLEAELARLQSGAQPATRPKRKPG